MPGRPNPRYDETTVLPDHLETNPVLVRGEGLAYHDVLPQDLSLEPLSQTVVIPRVRFEPRAWENFWSPCYSHTRQIIWTPGLAVVSIRPSPHNGCRHWQWDKPCAYGSIVGSRKIGACTIPGVCQTVHRWHMQVPAPCARRCKLPRHQHQSPTRTHVQGSRCPTWLQYPIRPAPERT